MRWAAEALPTAPTAVGGDFLLLAPRRCPVGWGLQGVPPSFQRGFGVSFPADTPGRAFLHPLVLRRGARRPAPSPGTRVCAADISAHPLLSTPPERGRDLIFSIVPSVSITPPQPFSAARPSPRPPLLLVADTGSRAGGQTKSSPPCPYPRGGSSPSLPFPRGLVPLPKSPSPCPPPPGLQ